MIPNSYGRRILELRAGILNLEDLVRDARLAKKIPANDPFLERTI